MNSKAYTKYFIFCLLFLLLLTATFNRIVDPLWYYRDVSIKGFNAIKTEYHSYERQVKPIFIKEYKPEVVIFSNSFLEVGFNSQHPSLTDNGKYRSYNYGIAGASWDKVYCNVLYAVDNTVLRTAVIGIQPGPLPEIDCSSKQQSISKLEQKTLLFSFDALRASFNTVRRQDRSPTHDINGLSYYHRGNGGQIEQVFKNDLSRYVMFPTKKNCQPLNFTENPSWSSPKLIVDTGGLKKLLVLLLSRHVKVILVVYPNHALWMDLLMSCGDLTERWQYLYKIATQVNEINNNSGLVELWDFQGTSDMLTEKINNGHVKYWQDHGHFNYEMGDVMLDVIFNNKQVTSVNSIDDFGVLLTPTSLIERFYNFFKNRKDFVQKNPWYINDFNKFTH